MKIIFASIMLIIASDKNVLATGNDAVTRINRLQTIAVNKTVSITFSGHSHKRTGVNGPKSPLIINMKFTVNGAVSDRSFYCQNEGSGKQLSFDSEGYTFFIADYAYNEFMDLIIKKDEPLEFTTRGGYAITAISGTDYHIARTTDTDDPSVKYLIAFNNRRITKSFIYNNGKLSETKLSYICRCPLSPQYMNIQEAVLPESKIYVVYDNFARIDILSGDEILEAGEKTAAQPKIKVMADLQKIK